MAREEFTPRYEEDENAILDRIVDNISDDWRKEPGDYVYDTVASIPIEILQLQVNQDETLKAGFARYAEDDDLDEKLYEVGLTRMQATENKRKLLIDADAGVVIPKGHTASVVVLDEGGNPLEFTVDEAVNFATTGRLEVDVTSIDVGAATNVANGSEFIFLPPIPGVRQITDGGTTFTARDKESDESALARYDYKLQYPDTGGNKHDYVRWASEIPGVGKVKVVPRWQNALRVKVVVVDDTYQPASQELVDDLQTYLDPGSTGMGDGKAPAGAQVFVFAAEALPIDITADVVYVEGTDPAAVQAAFEAAVVKYLKDLVFTSSTIGYNKVGALLGTQNAVVNFTNLLINGAAEDVAIGQDEAPTLGTVTLGVADV